MLAPAQNKTNDRFIYEGDAEINTRIGGNSDKPITNV
jgi:hypothetical protein